MTEEAAKEFRRASITINKVETIDSHKVEGILGILGQPFDQKQLTARLIQLQDYEGRLDLQNYNKIMKEFVTQKAACEKMAGDEFTFKHLINTNDFSTK